MRVKIVNGDQVDNKRKMLGVNVNIKGVSFNVNMYILVLNGCEMVLNVQWLQSLGSMLWDFSKLTMEFNCKQHAIKLNKLCANT